MPINSCLCTRSSTDSFEHPLCRVVTLLVRMCTLSGKVVDEDFRLLSDLTVIDRSATFGEKEQPVKLLKEDRRGLVDRTKNRLTMSSEFLEQLEDIP